MWWNSLLGVVKYYRRGYAYMAFQTDAKGSMRTAGHVAEPLDQMVKIEVFLVDVAQLVVAVGGAA